jgi:hypothetical protein
MKMAVYFDIIKITWSQTIAHHNDEKKTLVFGHTM